MDKHTEAGVVADLASRAAEPRLMTTEDGQTWLVAPEGCDVQLLADARQDVHGLKIAAPVRIKAAVVLQTVASLVDYVNRFKGEQTTLFADIASNRILAAVDYHGPGSADHVDHTAALTLPFSVEWDAWKSQDGKLVEQQAFARWLEENAAEVVAPMGADLLEICRDLQAVRRADFKRVVRTNGDDERLEYTENSEATAKNGSIEVPSKFQLSLPVYFGEGAVTLFAFLRWKLNEGALLLGYQLHRVEHVRQAVFQQIVLDVADRTGCPAVFGKLG